ncbi:MAG: glycoside hydrolase family 78 protein [Bacteroidetes bacterium]|uniref:family 78 glycoside hydrolase catalytic domain n=1 Tax=Phnomibacter sp. TaxID=2836217 RepID=UPI002FDC948B|nr:glycoside hydrolase family 78 protein [Bacteroidota bacterium]
MTVLTSAQSLRVGYLRCEARENPLGVVAKRPMLSWELYSAQLSVVQTAFQILVADDSLLLKRNVGNVWDSKKRLSAASIQVPYNGKALQAAKKYYWKIRAWDNKGNVSAWSEIALWQMGLMEPKDWAGAKWIAYENLPDSLRIVPAAHGNGDKAWGKRANVLPLLRTQFAASKKVKQATAFICGLGQFELYINGQKTGDHFLDPGWTKYNKQAQYVTFDVTKQLLVGNNAIGVMLGNGFYYIPGERYRKMTGAYGYPKMIFRLLIEYTDGSIQQVVSDEQWKTAPSPITYSSLYGGENYDARLEQKGWHTPAFNDAQWRPAVVATPHHLQSQLAKPVKVMQSFEAMTVQQLKDNVWLYDFGQNMSGIPAIKVSGNRGDTIKLTPAELLTEDGRANQKATGASSYYLYVLSGDGVEQWQPKFTYYGFRYVQLELLPASTSNKTTQLLAVQALHTRNSAAAVGAFQNSDTLFNLTNHLIQWAINSNMQSVFTDCPHRERLGWQEQLHLMGNALQYNYEIHALGKKITADIRAEQNANGLVPSTIPEYTEMHFANGYFRDSPEWGSNAILMPWNLYQWYGDKQELLTNYTTMQRYMQYLRSKDSSHLLMYGLSDWYDLGPERPGFCQLTPMGLTATAYYYYNLRVMQQTATLLGKKADALHYSKWADSVSVAFNRQYFNDTVKQYGTGSQTSNAVALSMGLVAEKNTTAVLANLIQSIEQNDYRLTAGDIGFHHLLKVLSQAGRSDVIFRMNNRSDVPGYGYQLAKGATALTESWQGSPIVSNNHFMLGHLMEWFYASLAGIQASHGAVAFRQLRIQPQVVGDVTEAEARFRSPYGWVASSWKKNDTKFTLQVHIPVNSTATVYLPAGSNSIIHMNQQPVKAPVQKGLARMAIGSGEYVFTVVNQ